MVISELVTALNRVQQLAGDLPVVLKHVEQDAVTVLKAIGVHLDLSGESAAGQVQIEHGDAPPAPVVTFDPSPVNS